MCFFHNYGKVEADGFQYCKNCGKARKPSIPHPCCNGHLWKDTGEPNYIITTFDYGKRREYFVPQKCTRCGERRSVSQY